MNKKLLISLSIIGIVAAIAIGGTIAYFSDVETSTGNTLTAGTLDLRDLDYVTWEFDFEDMKPGDTTGVQTIDLEMEEGSNASNHVEIDIDTHDFIDGVVPNGGVNTKDDFKKQIKVNTLKYFDSVTTDLLTLVDDNADGNLGFKSLYDVEAYGVFDDLLSFGTGAGRFKVELSLPTDLPDANDNKYQGDSIQIDFEFGVAQVAGQDVLTD